MGHTATGRTDSNRYLKLLPFPDVRTRIEAALTRSQLGLEYVSVDHALGRICAEDVRSDCDIPAMSVSAMDGYALRSSYLEAASSSHPAIFRIRNTIDAEKTTPPTSSSADEAVQVSTGDPIPEGCDVVARLEDTRLVGNQLVIGRLIEKWKNISLQGEDVHKGELLLRPARPLSSADVALLMAVGRKRIKVSRMPRVGILSTGSELREFSPEVENRDDSKTINNYSNLVAGFLRELGALAVPLGIARDDADDIKERIRSGLAEHDMLITIAGSSVGTRDHVPSAVLAAESNARLVFHGVRVVPIRPAGMALADGKPIVILPGHAVSATLTFFTIALPVLNLISGLPFDARRVLVSATASEEVSNDRMLDALFLFTLERNENGEYQASPLRWGSNLISNLSKAKGFVWLHAKQRLERGAKLRVELMGCSELSRVL